MEVGINMTKISPYQEFTEAEFEKLDLYSKAIANVHGKNHPELNQVRELFLTIQSKSAGVVGVKPDLDEEFKTLQTVTHDYDVPADGCETYQATYDLLQQAEIAYSKS